MHATNSQLFVKELVEQLMMLSIPSIGKKGCEIVVSTNKYHGVDKTHWRWQIRWNLETEMVMQE